MVNEWMGYYSFSGWTLCPFVSRSCYIYLMISLIDIKFFLTSGYSVVITYDLVYSPGVILVIYGQIYQSPDNP